MAKRVVKSEDVSEFVGYWLHTNGDIVERKAGTVMPTYSSGVVRLMHIDGKKQVVPAHRLIAQAFLENPEGHSFVKFKDGDRTNRSVENLEWAGSVKELGETSREIIRLFEQGSTGCQIAYLLNKTPQYVNRVLKDHRKKNNN